MVVVVFNSLEVPVEDCGVKPGIFTEPEKITCSNGVTDVVVRMRTEVVALGVCPTSLSWS